MYVVVVMAISVVCSMHLWLWKSRSYHHSRKLYRVVIASLSDIGPEGISVSGWNWTNYLLFVMQMGKPLYYVVTKLDVTAHNKKNSSLLGWQIPKQLFIQI